MGDGAWTGGVSEAFTAEMQAQARTLRDAREQAVASTQDFAAQVRVAEQAAAQLAAGVQARPR